MTSTERRLAADLLDLASEKFGDFGCNDWKWPDYVSGNERLALAITVERMNVGGRELTVKELEAAQREATGKYGPGDDVMMWFLARRLSDPNQT